ncbi:membrane protein [Shewanella sp. NFH-SH190041]|uniref:glycine zipper 2TM domain-containing protein n=1 Tax=Shewanella sp. NFH-SH190041 TaxID=2950245 RepID=UPI0021C405BA|nr:glycine zipper 2TM domain-containing protein [Shewanella sp. NFH-SH190041]BDM64051.1 membrane protein [Shewanella sp. NFH-SH190041]
MKHTVLGALVLTALFGLGGCATNPYGDAYTVADAQQIQTVQTGTILKLNAVKLQGQNGNALGTLAGGAIGALLGSDIGGGTGAEIAAIGGGVLGAAAGSQAGQAIDTRQGVNMIIRLDNGETIAIVQQVDPKMIFRVGERVNIFSLNGSARVVPAN